MQNKYLDAVHNKGLYWFIQDTRCKLVGNKLDKATLDHFFKLWIFEKER